MSRPLVRLLVIPRGADADSDGRKVGDDWLLATLGSDDDGAYYLTTDGVRASELGDWPGLRPRELGEWMVRRINAAADRQRTRFDEEDEEDDLDEEDDEWPAYVAPRPCLPPDAAWVPVDGREWATNTHVLVPRDGEPFDAAGWREGPDCPPPEDIRRLLAALSEPAVRGGLSASTEGPTPGGSAIWLAARGRRVYVATEYEPLLRRGTPRQRADLAPVAVWSDDRLIAVVMPRKAP